jgi:uncharacterized protein
MRIVLILLRSLVCFLGCGVANAQSPSFDCRKARLPDEFAICHSSQLTELDNLVAAGYVFLKSTQGRPAADQVGIPFWRLRQSCRLDEACIQQRQIEAIKAYHAAGAPVSLPSWASLQAYGSNSGVSPQTPQDAPLVPPVLNSAGIGDTTAQMVSDGGTFKVPVTVNGQLTLNFTVDSGASDVSIPADVVMTLVRTGTITDADYLDKQTYRLADGSTLPSQRFVIRSLRVGDKTVGNVVGSIAPVEGSLLLGQSFLGRFDSWSIDNHLQALVLRSSSSTANATDSPAQSQATAPSTIAASPSRFPHALIGKLLPPYCHMGACSWISIENRESIGARSDGELFRVTTRFWEAEYPDDVSYDGPARRTGGEFRDDYVFCSTTHPAVASSLGNGKWIADTLSPDQSAGVFGYNISTYTLYFAACHGLAIDDPTHANARALGYNTNAEWVRQVDITSPSEISNLR